MDKEHIRKEIYEKRSLLTNEYILTESNKIIDLLMKQPEYVMADVILTYVSFEQEVETIPLILASLHLNKRVAVPKIMKKGIMEFIEISNINDLRPGKFGILEPVSKIPITYNPAKRYLAIMPGLAFDRKLHRIGYGGGYYDRYFNCIKNIHLTSIAIAFDFQIYEEIPSEKYDFRPDKIITPSEILI